MIRAAPAVTILVMLGPVMAGLAGTVLPALGWLPALGGDTISLATLGALFAVPGLLESVLLSGFIGLGSTAVSLVLALAFIAAAHGTRAFEIGIRFVSPLLSVPHVTMAIGVAFLIAPSGWLVRLISPWLTGWDRPPDVLIVHDPWGLTLAGALVLKETPFLFLMMVAALDRVPTGRIVGVGRSMGYAPMTAWLKGVLPQIYPRMRLPIFAVIAFASSNVETAILLGPSTPAPLSVRVVQWMNDPDLEQRFLGSAGALLQAVVTLCAIALWLTLERLARWIGRRWIEAGGRGGGEAILRRLAVATLTGALAVSIAAIAALVVWSVAGAWRFPDPIPATFSLAGWRRGGDDLIGAAVVTAGVAIASASVALVLVVACLENETRRRRQPGAAVDRILYTPLLVPQVAFLFGIQVLLVVTRVDGGIAAVAWSHLVFVLPYVFLSLAGPWRRFDRRYGFVGLTLGRSPTGVLFRVTLPLLIRPVLTAWAVGVAVSVALYLPTLFAGGGRVATLTTEAVALAAGGDRRVIGAFGLLQVVLPLLAFSLAHVLSARLGRPPAGAGLAPPGNGR